MSLTCEPEIGRIFVDPQAYADLDVWHESAAQLRRENPVLRVNAEGYDPFWAITRHADVTEIERRNDIFWNTMNSTLRERGAAEAARAQGAAIKTLIHMDGAEHRAYRRITNDWFKPANLRQTLEVEIKRLARLFVDRMLEFDGECDFAADIALYYPLRVIMSVLGVSESDEPLMLALTQKLFSGEDPDFGGDREKAVISALRDMMQYFNHMTVDRRARPQNDIASTIANATLDGEPLGDFQTLGYYIIIATAGHDTTSSSLAGGLAALLQHPDQFRVLRDDPSLLDTAIDEMIRWVSPVRHFLRTAQQDYLLNGMPIQTGDVLLLSYLSANRDEAVFPESDRFDIRRKNAADHLAFGLGVHFCLGVHLARMEMKVFFQELLARLDSIALNGEPEYTATTFVGGPKHVPIRYRIRPTP